MGASFDLKLLKYPCKCTVTGYLPEEMSVILGTFSFPCKGVIYCGESTLVALTL